METGRFSFLGKCIKNRLQAEIDLFLQEAIHIVFKMARSTLRIVAETAGVSIATASLALKDDPRVTEVVKLPKPDRVVR